jgi:hypothetical protein
MPATTATTSIWSLATARDWLRIPPSATERDDEIAALADAVTVLIERERQEQIVSRAIVEILPGTGHSRLLLGHCPVTTFTSLAIVRTPGQTAETITAFDVDLAAGIVQLRSDIFTVGVANVAATYTAGYGAQDAATLPRDVYTAGLDLLKILWDSKDTGTIAASSVGVGVTGTFVIRQDWPPHVRRMLERGRIA